MNTTPSRQIFLKGLAKISLDKPIDPILSFLEGADRAFRKCILLPPTSCIVLELWLPYFLGLAPPIRLQILISAPVRVSAPPSDKRPVQISLDFDQKDGEPELYLDQLTCESLGLFFFY